MVFPAAGKRDTIQDIVTAGFLALEIKEPNRLLERQQGKMPIERIPKKKLFSGWVRY